MLAGAQPRAAHQRRRSERRAAHNVGPSNGGLKILDHFDFIVFSGEAPCDRVGALGPPFPNAHAANRPHRGMVLDRVRRQTAGAYHQQPRGFGNKISSRERRGRSVRRSVSSVPSSIARGAPVVASNNV